MKELKFNMDLVELKEQIENEDLDCLLFLGQLKRLENEFKELKSLALENALSEFDKYNEKSVKLGEFVFSKTQSGRYSYKHSDEWLKINKEQKNYEDLMKQAYNAAKKDNIIVDKNGEIVEQAIYQHNKESISIKLR